MKFSQLIEYNVRNNVLENFSENEAERLLFCFFKSFI